MTASTSESTADFDRAYELFGERLTSILDELNKRLGA